MASVGATSVAPPSAHRPDPGEMGDRRMGLRARAFLLFLASLSLSAGLAVTSGCIPGRFGEGAVIVVDDARDTVRLARPATRVVSLIPASTELLFALGAGPQVVGRTRWCDYPAAAMAVTDVGDGINPNLEAVAALRPDLVVLYLGGSNAEAATRLRSMGIAVVQLRTDLLESVARHAILLGELTGRRIAGDSLAQAFEGALTAATVSIHPEARTPRRQTIFVPAWDQPLITIGSGSFLDELITRAGGVNVFHDLPQASAPVSLEAVVARDPDLILTTAAEAPTLAQRPEWRVLRAVRERRFVRVHGSEFDRPGPRSPQAISALTAALFEAQR